MKTDKEEVEKDGLLAQKELSVLFTIDGKTVSLIEALRAKGFTNEQCTIVGRFMRCYQWYGFSQGENYIKSQFKALFDI